jgi:hypothetical protein
VYSEDPLIDHPNIRSEVDSFVTLPQPKSRREGAGRHKGEIFSRRTISREDASWSSHDHSRGNRLVLAIKLEMHGFGNSAAENRDEALFANHTLSIRVII